MKKEDTLYLEIALDEMQKLFTAQISGFDSIKTNVRAVLSSASLIVSLVSALQILAVRIDPNYLWIYRAGIGLAALLYVALISLCISALLPVSVIHPLAAEWDVVVTAYKGLPYKKAITTRLASVVETIEINRPALNRFKKMQTAALILLPILVITLLLLTLIPKA